MFWSTHGVTDYEDWKEAEADFIGARMGALREHPITGAYDLPHLQAIHAYLTQDMYSWGGEIRDTDTHPGGTGIAHCRPQFIVAEGRTRLRHARRAWLPARPRCGRVLGRAGLGVGRDDSDPSIP